MVSGADHSLVWLTRLWVTLTTQTTAGPIVTKGSIPGHSCFQYSRKQGAGKEMPPRVLSTSCARERKDAKSGICFVQERIVTSLLYPVGSGEETFYLKQH